MEQKRIKVRLTENSPYSNYGYYEKGDIGYIDGYVNDNAVIILENGKFAKADLRWIEVVNEEDKNVNTELKESEDEKMINAVIGALKDTAIAGYGNYDVEDLIAWLEKQGEQKHIAEEVLIKAGLKPYKDGDQWCVLLGDNIQEGICGFGNTIEDALYAFLKDLIASQGEQKPVEWSEEEEEIIDEILHSLDACESEWNSDMSKEKDWLKSLRPQKQWKPSEKQIEAIRIAAADSFYQWVCETYKEPREEKV